MARLQRRWFFSHIARSFYHSSSFFPWWFDGVSSIFMTSSDLSTYRYDWKIIKSASSVAFADRIEIKCSRLINHFVSFSFLIFQLIFVRQNMFFIFLELFISYFINSNIRFRISRIFKHFSISFHSTSAWWKWDSFESNRSRRRRFLLPSQHLLSYHLWQMEKAGQLFAQLAQWKFQILCSLAMLKLRQGDRHGDWMVWQSSNSGTLWQRLFWENFESKIILFHSKLSQLPLGSFMNLPNTTLKVAFASWDSEEE
jgi:hypothetical protein